MVEKIRILLVDDQRLMREGLKTILELEKNFEVVGEADNGESAIKAYKEYLPSVVLMDIRMPVMDGVEATRKIKNLWPDARIIILTTFDDDKDVFEGLRAGAMGYLLKDTSGSELSEAIYTVAAGGALIEPSIARKVLAEFTRLQPTPIKQETNLPGLLTDRELEILRLLAQGLSNKQISKALFLAEGTVKNYISSLFDKLNVSDRTQAAIRARELNLF
jgi:DNA-binding NarL/FixJ family response regulator